MQSTHGKMSFRKKLRRAFTITELVIVIAVIAILAAVLIPTFSNVIENSKRSHDEQYVKEMNISLNAYAIQNGAPEDYEELMLALAGDGYCDASNPFLLATSLKQDNVYLVWYPRSNSISLINVSDSNYSITFSSEIGLGNGVLVHDALGNSSTLGYTLCSTGTSDGAYIAGVYRDFYINSGGDLTKFNQNFGNQYTAEAIKDNVSDSAWGSSISAALTNQKLGYTYSATIAEEITSQAAAGSASVSLDIPSTSGDNAVSEAVQEQVVRSTLATLVSVSNDTDTASDLAGKNVVFGSGGSSLASVTVDLDGVTMSAIHPTHRDTIEANTSLPSSYSVDFGGLTLDNYEITEAFVASGASWQTADDNDYTGGAYNYSYGLFGSLYAKPGETVVIENLNITNVNLELDGNATDAAGNSAQIITDSAGIVCGTAIGNVTFRNINIDGTQADGSQGYIHGYDAIGGIVGRCYGPLEADKTTGLYTATITNCHVSNLKIAGVRKVGGFAGIFGQGSFLTVTDSSLTNVDVVGFRDIAGDSAEDRKSTIAGMFVAHVDLDGNENNQNGTTEATKVTFTNIEVTDCTCVNYYENLNEADAFTYLPGGLCVAMDADYDATGSDVTMGNENYLKIFGNLETYYANLTNITVKDTAHNWEDVFEFIYNKTDGAKFSAWNSGDPVLMKASA